MSYETTRMVLTGDRMKLMLSEVDKAYVCKVKKRSNTPRCRGTKE